MKKFLLIILTTISCALFVACTEEQKADRAYDDFKEYVNQHTDSIDGYYDQDWTEMENEFNEKRLKAEGKMKEWNEETKAEFETLQSDWENFRAQHEGERNRRTMEQNTAAMVSELLPEGVASDLNNANAANLFTVHKHFVDYVELHKDDLTREQWDRVEFMWEALGTRKNELEKELQSGENLKIAEQKVRFGAIKAANRPGAKAEENAEAKSE